MHIRHKSMEYEKGTRHKTSDTNIQLYRAITESINKCINEMIFTNSF